MYEHLVGLAVQHIVTDDDQLVFDALKHNDVQHACQAIREAQSGEVKFQHLTLRFGMRGEQSVYQFKLSEQMQYCLDLFSLYLALRQTQFQLEDFHHDLISNVVVPIRVDALLWQSGVYFLEQTIQFHSSAFQHVIPSLQADETLCDHDKVATLAKKLKENAYALWFEVSTSQANFERVADFSPDMIKLSVTLEDKEERHAFLPIAKFLRKHKYTWVAGRVASQTELNRYRLLGASYYFGYFNDIPTSLSFQSFDEE
ncbi:EAL domain-containing protein [Vibrio diabolicus]|uniref:EAL domain-containing protein n=1 Tax=Vibrio diabolicus TaxID=50719 RepID=UPI0035A90529